MGSSSKEETRVFWSGKIGEKAERGREVDVWCGWSLGRMACREEGWDAKGGLASLGSFLSIIGSERSLTYTHTYKNDIEFTF